MDTIDLSASASPVPPPAPGGRAEHLIIVRVGPKQPPSALDAAVAGTLAGCPGIPRAAALARQGADLARRPGDYGALVLTAPGAQAVLFQIDGTCGLYGSGKPAAPDAAPGSGFAAIVLDVLTELRPVNVYVAGMRTLTRDTALTPDLIETLDAHVGTLHVGGIAVAVGGRLQSAAFARLLAP